MAIKKFDNFGRIVPVCKRIRRKYRKQKVEVKVSFWLAKFDPPYKSGDHLFYETETAKYRVYNPLGYSFELEQLVAYLRNWHMLYEGEEILQYGIIEVPT